MTGKVSRYGLTSIVTALALFIGACAGPNANLTGFSVTTGIERKPSDFEKVKIYLKSPLSISVLQNYRKLRVLMELSKEEQDLASFPQLPDSYEYIGYVEGIKQFEIPNDLELFYSTIVDLRKESRTRAFELMRQNAARIGSDGIVLTSVTYESGYSDSDSDSDSDSEYARCVVAGWAVHVLPEDFPSNNTRVNVDKQEKCGDFRIYIENPQQCQILGDISSQQEFEYHKTWRTPGSAIKEGFKELKKKVIDMGGNGLRIKTIVRKVKVDREQQIFDMLMDSFFLPFSEGQPDTYYEKYYDISGQAIKVACGDEFISPASRYLYKNEPNHNLLSYKVTKLHFPQYAGEVAVLVGEEPGEDSIYVLHLTVSTNKLTKEESLEWMKAEAAEHGADTIVPDRVEPLGYKSGDYLYWTAQAYRTKNLEDAKWPSF